VSDDVEQRILGRYWHAAAYSSALDAGPVSVVIVGEPIVVVRLDGEAIAARDQCPHRGAALSSGRVVERSSECLVCPYHGMHFDSAGRAVHLPARTSDRLPSRLNLDLLRCVEQHGIVWVSLAGDPVGSPPDWRSYDDPANAHFQLGLENWPVMASRVAENFNDVAHFATVHAATFGDADPRDIATETIDITGAGVIRHELPMYQLDRVTLDGPLVPIKAEYSYVHTMPFSSELRITFDEERVEWIQLSATPIGPTSALIFQQNVRNFDLDGDLEAWADFQAAVNAEDRDLLTTIRPARISLDGSDANEVALSVDVFTIAYRRLWSELIARG
jgi:phenylpropionate dioxygenase-like ring-hydroxylating dioxygenase large terminal subunit